MIEKLISLIELKEITSQLKLRMKSNIDASNDVESHQKILLELTELNLEYQDFRTEDETLLDRNFSDFYDYKHNIYEPLNLERIQELCKELEVENDAKFLKKVIALYKRFTDI